MDVHSIDYYYGSLPNEWEPTLSDLVDVEVFCSAQCGAQAATLLEGRGDWRKCLDRIDFLVGPEVEGEEGMLYLAQLTKRGASALVANSVCGFCDDHMG